MRKLRLFSILCYLHIILCCLWSYTKADCTIVPVSLSDLRFCSGNTCSFRQQASIELPIDPGSNICFSFISPDPTASPTTFSLSVYDSYFQFDSSSVYYTDSPMVDTKTVCGCPGGKSATCPFCDSLLPIGDTVLCSESTHTDKSCPANWFISTEVGTVCSKTGLSGRNRFKIAQYKPTYALKSHFTAAVGNKTWPIYYDGKLTESSPNDTPFNITIISDSAVPLLYPQFTVIDSTSPSDFYLLDDSQVNSIDSYDLTKIGWYKTDQTQKVSATLGSDIKVSPLFDGCLSDAIKVVHPWVDPEVKLTNLKDRLSSRFSYAIRLDDSDYRIAAKSPKSDPTHTLQDYVYVSDGWQFLNNNGQPTNIGFNIINGLRVPTATNGNIGVRNINCRFTDGEMRSFNDANWKTQNVIFRDLDVTGFPLSNIDVYARDEFPNALCYCYNKRIAAGGFEAPNCDLPPLHTITYPEAVPARHRVVTSKFMKEFTDHTSFDNTTGLLIPSQKGSFQIIINFDHLNLTFDTTSARPKINDLIVNDTTVIFVAQSTTVGGLCYAYSDPADIIITQGVNLAVTPSSFPIPINRDSFNGVAKFAIRCHNFNSTVLKTLQYDNSENQTSSNSSYIQMGNFDGFNPNLWPSLFNNAIDGDGLFSQNGLTNGISWFHYLQMSLIFLAFVVVFVLISLPVYKFLKLRYRMMKLRSLSKQSKAKRLSVPSRYYN